MKKLERRAILFLLLAAALIWLLGVSPILVVLAAIAAGWIYSKTLNPGPRTPNDDEK